MADTRKCAHPSCSCTVTGKEKFCSAQCEGAAGTASITCKCGHPGCQGEVRT